MRRTDRLYDLIQILRDGRLHRAADLAQALQVSPRTIWRDMMTLATSGMPIEGERGVGYILRTPMTLPPMMITTTELEALRQGLRLVVGGNDAGLMRAAKSLAGKIAAVTPRPSEADDLFGTLSPKPALMPAFIPLLRRAIRARLLVQISHISLNHERHSDMRPLCLDLKSTIWTLIAYCQIAKDFRVLRLDQITAVLPTSETFPKQQGRELADFRAARA
jgi:predicted DNA-binding transcriptional regulator YafY